MAPTMAHSRIDCCGKICPRDRQNKKPSGRSKILKEQQEQSSLPVPIRYVETSHA